MRDELRICHVFATFAPGGPQVRIANIFNSLPDRFSHTILAMDGNTSASALIRPEVRVKFVDAERAKWGPAYGLYLGRKLRALRPDLLTTHNWGSMDAAVGAALCRVRPWVHMETGFEADEAVSPKRRRVVARRWLLRAAAAVIVPSRNLERMARDEWKVSPERVRLVANGVDCDRFVPGNDERFRSSLGIHASAVVVGTVAHLRPVKDPLGLLDAFADVAGGRHDSHLVYFGEGEMRPAIEQRARERGLVDRVHLPGHVTDAAACHRSLDLFALCSRSEQSPVSVLEAMACGRPVLSTDVGEVKESVAGPNADHVTALDDRDAYRAALASLLADRGLRERIGAANRARAVDRFGLAAMVDRYREIYEQAAQGGAPAG
ncbi:MAG: glycosyltransferase [Planctomycetota bacterium]